MKAIRLHGRGGAEDLFYEDAPMPVPPSGYALVRVYATGITPAELSWGPTYETCDGAERIPSIPGHEISGIVEEVTSGVSAVKRGDAVYALTEFCRDGSAAEYVAVRGTDLASKPQTLDHAHAAAVPLSALTAWQAFFDHAGLRAGQRVLILGASGGVGHFAVQLAKWQGAYVIGTASPDSFSLLKEFGADELIDYTSAHYEDKLHDLDVVLDTVGGDTLERSWQVLRRGGTLITLPSPPPPERAMKYGVRGLFFIVKPNRAQLIEIARLIDAGELRPIVSDILPLERAREAFDRGLKNHVRGKLVLRVVPEKSV